MDYIISSILGVVVVLLLPITLLISISKNVGSNKKSKKSGIVEKKK